MAASIGNLALLVSANITPLTSSLRTASSGISGFARGVSGSLSGVAGSILGGLGQIGHAIHGVRAIIDLIDNSILAPVKAAARFEVVVASMSGMLGSMEKAQKVASDIFSFAGSTPFTATELLDASKKMLAVGTSVNQVSDTIKVLGDVSAGSGKDLNELTVLFSQVRSAGRLLGQDMLQFNQANIPLSTALAKRFNISELALRKMVEAGKVGFRDVAEEIQKMTEAGGLFHDQMELRSRTLTGRWAKVANEFRQGMIQIGNSMVENLHIKALLDDVLILGQAFRDWMAEGGLQRTWEWLAGAVDTVGGKFLDFVDILRVLHGHVAPFGLAMNQTFVNMLEGLKPVMGAFAEIQERFGKIISVHAKMARLQEAYVRPFSDTSANQYKAIAEALESASKLSDRAVSGAIKSIDALETGRQKLQALVDLGRQLTDAISGGAQIGDSRKAFEAGMQSFNDWMAGMRAAAEAKKPGFWGSLFESVRGSIAAGAATMLGGGDGKLAGASGAAVRGSQEAERIIARSQGGGWNKVEKIQAAQLDVAKQIKKAVENVAAEVRRAAGEVIVDF